MNNWLIALLTPFRQPAASAARPVRMQPPTRPVAPAHAGEARSAPVAAPASDLDQGLFVWLLAQPVDPAAALAAAERLQLIQNATSLGAVESLIEHRESVEGPGSPTPANLLRLSVGLEDCEDLMADLAQALDG